MPLAALGNTWNGMKTLTVKVPDELGVRLEKRARRLGLSKSAIVRESIEKELERSVKVEEEPSAYDLMKEGIGCIDSGVSDLASNPRHMEGFGR